MKWKKMLQNNKLKIQSCDVMVICRIKTVDTVIGCVISKITSKDHIVLVLTPITTVFLMNQSSKYSMKSTKDWISISVVVIEIHAMYVVNFITYTTSWHQMLMEYRRLSALKYGAKFGSHYGVVYWYKTILKDNLIRYTPSQKKAILGKNC